MYCEICKNSKTGEKEEFLTLSKHAYAQVTSILKLSDNNPANKINKENLSVSVCVKCLQGA